MNEFTYQRPMVVGGHTFRPRASNGLDNMEYHDCGPMRLIRSVAFNEWAVEIRDSDSGSVLVGPWRSSPALAINAGKNGLRHLSGRKFVEVSADE